MQLICKTGDGGSDDGGIAIGGGLVALRRQVCGGLGADRAEDRPREGYTGRSDNLSGR